MSALPCPTCPWRVDQSAESIPRYNHEKACGLLNTVGEGDDFRPIMACHGSTEEQLYACNGYLAREGWSNLNVRVLLSRGVITNTPDEVAGACEEEGIELHPNYRAVLDKLSRR